MIKRIVLTFWLALSLHLSIVPSSWAEVELSTTSILAKAAEFESLIKKATFKFEEEFTLLPTQEKEKIKGRVYLDRENSRVRVDYTGGVRAKVWIDKDSVYFYDESLDQVVIRKVSDFEKVHFQAFMDIPLVQGMANFESRFRFKLHSSSAAADATVALDATPHKTQTPYYLVLRFNGQTGEPKGLDLVMENYLAALTLSNFDRDARFKGSIFDKKFSPHTAVLDLTKEK